MQPTIWEWPQALRGTTESQFYLAPSSLSSVSPYTGQQTAYGPQVQRWMANLTFPALRPEQWRPLTAFMSRLRGITGMVRMVDYHRMKPAIEQFGGPAAQQLWADGRPWSDGSLWSAGVLPPYVVAGEAAPEGADSLVLRDLPAGLAGCLQMGDLVEVRPNGIPAVHGFLHEVVADSSTDASGRTRIYVEPGLRAGVAAGDMVVLHYPTSVFTLSTDDQGIVNRGLTSRGTLGLALHEVMPWQ
jgi:hypothetical protein